MKEQKEGNAFLRCVLENHRAVSTSVGKKEEEESELNF